MEVEVIEATGLNVAGKRRIDMCMNCGEEKEIAAHGLCYRCYRPTHRGKRQAGTEDFMTSALSREHKKLFGAHGDLLKLLLKLNVNRADRLAVKGILSHYFLPIHEQLRESFAEEEDAVPVVPAPMWEQPTVNGDPKPDGSQAVNIEQDTNGSQFTVDDRWLSLSGVNSEPEISGGSQIVNGEHANDGSLFTHAPEERVITVAEVAAPAPMWDEAPSVNGNQKPDGSQVTPQPCQDPEDVTVIPLGDGDDKDVSLYYCDRFLPDPEKWLVRLREEIPWSPETIKMYGRPLVLRRQTCNYGEDYDYNVNAKPAIPFSGAVLELKQILEQFTEREFTQCACNLYPDGETGIGLHHDKRHPLLVASISFGTVRTMGFAPKGGKLMPQPRIALANGSLIVFSNTVNEKFKHTIIEDKSSQPRISVTFRCFNPEQELKGNR